MNKEELRKHFKHLRQNLPLSEWFEKSMRICDLLLQSSFYLNAKRIAFYHYIDKEVNLNPAIDVALKEKEVYLPRTSLSENMLSFHRIFSRSELKFGAFAVLEPPSERFEIDPGELDLILVPGLAFDRDRGRLGYGGGFYDRALSKTRAFKIGIAFSFQVVEKLPLDAHDVKVDLILTEEGFI